MAGILHDFQIFLIRNAPKFVLRPFLRGYLTSLSSAHAEYGLYLDDTVTGGRILYQGDGSEKMLIEEAVSRLPAEVQVARYRRIKRAQDLMLKKEKLPESMRPDDREVFTPYLQPYIQQVVRELAERRTYDAKLW